MPFCVRVRNWGVRVRNWHVGVKNLIKVLKIIIIAHQPKTMLPNIKIQPDAPKSYTTAQVFEGRKRRNTRI